MKRLLRLLCLFTLLPSVALAQGIGSSGSTSGAAVTANQGSPSASGPWIVTPWINGSVNASGNPLFTIQPPSAASGIGIAPVVSGAAEATHVLKASAGNLYAVYATNLTATAGFLVVLNATSAPADGAITPIDCVPLLPNSSTSINYQPGPPGVYSTGITAVITSATTCFTKTTGVITGFIHGDIF